MAELMDTLERHLDASTIDGLSRRLGADSSVVSRIVSMAVPMLVAGLSKNAEDPGGRESLDRALQEDHDGSLLDRLGSMLGGSEPSGGAGGGLGGLAGTVGGLLGGGGSGSSGPPSRAADGEGILHHLLGERRGAVEDGAARATGSDRGQVSSVLSAVAPLVMSALGRVKRERDLSPDGVAELVDRERQELERKTPDTQEGDLRRVLESAGGDELSSWVGRLGSSLGGSVGPDDEARS